MSAVAVPFPSEYTAKGVVLQRENPSEFAGILAAMEADYDPQTIIERQLCRQIAESSWRLRRCTEIETDLFNSSSGFAEIADNLNKLSRYRSSVEREFHKSIDQLTKLQERRRKANAEPAKPQPKAKKKSPLDDLLRQYLFAPMPGHEPEPELEPEPEPEEDEIGFVLQNSESA